MDNLEKFIVSFILSLICLCFIAFHESEVEYQQFNEECIKDHKQYECTTMWRSHESSAQLVPVIIPTR